MNRKIDDARRVTNPLFNDDKFKLGVFGFNGKAAQLTHGPGPDVTWARSSLIAGLADAAGLEAIVPYTRWRAALRSTRRPSTSPHDVSTPMPQRRGSASRPARARSSRPPRCP